MHTTCATATTGRRTTVEPHICQPIVWPSVDYFNALPYVNKNLSCRKQIVRQLRRQYVEGIYRPKYHTVTLKTRLSVTQCHWKRYHWIDHTRLTISRVIWRWILSWPSPPCVLYHFCTGKDSPACHVGTVEFPSLTDDKKVNRYNTGAWQSIEQLWEIPTGSPPAGSINISRFSTNTSLSQTIQDSAMER